MIDAAIVVGTLLILWWTCDRDARLRGTHSRSVRRVDNATRLTDHSDDERDGP